MHSFRSLSSLGFLFPLFLLVNDIVEAAVKVDFTKRAGSPTLGRRTVGVTGKKDLTYELGGGYYATISVGNPPQPVELLIDTGSSDLVVQSPQSCGNRGKQNPCGGGTFDPSKSSSYKVTAPGQFNTMFQNGEATTGDIATDDVSFGGVTLQNATVAVGLAANGTTHTGLIGIGYDRDANAGSSTILNGMVKAGIIKSEIFSVWLDDMAADSGSILFGGIDESKFDTNAGLVTLDILTNPLDNRFDKYLVSMTNISATIGGQVISPPLSSAQNANSSGSLPYLPVVADTGAPAMIVPPQVFTAINQYVGAMQPPGFDQHYGLFCSEKQNQTLQNSIISWTLGDPKNTSISITYNVTLSDLVVPIFIPGTRQPYSMPGPEGKPAELCAFGLQPPTPGSQFYLMGDPFLRAMFVVFDQNKNQLSFGKPVFNSTRSTPVTISSNSTLPDVVVSEPASDARTLTSQASNPVTATASASGSGSSSTSGGTAKQTGNAAAGLTTPTLGGSMLVAFWILIMGFAGIFAFEL
ncbi:acid protease [Viridothelium virens]|uniref:Acid protease n=1 Tax=Viridothelium virens TaxID=1048519 RepID=A0A6A6HDX8_VIRVR|nr:acid protease [Viridothelium virens]